MIRWLVDHATTVLLLVFGIFIAGIWSYVTLPREASPDITIPVVLVSVPYVGVSPEDIESLVTIPLENELASLTDVKTMTSTSAEGVCVVAIEFEPDVIIEDALQKVRDRVSRADVPDDAEDADIREIAFSDIPIVIVTIAGEIDEEILRELGEKLQDDASRLPGVLEARLSGGLKREIRVQVDPIRLAHYGLSLDDVVGAIGNENVNIPGGTVKTGAGSFLLRVPGEFTEPRQLDDVAIKRVGDRPVFVRDIATVVDGFEDRQTLSRMNGEPAVSLSISKRPGANIIDVADAAKALAAEHAKTWPAGVHHEVLADQSTYIRNTVTELQNNILTALILVIGVILFFMGFRNSLFVALSIPLSMFIGFAVLQALGFTLNMIVLFSLIMALGMLVDNAIVVVENIYRHAEAGKDERTASIDGTNEVAIAVTASTLTTVAAFGPLVFWGGIMGEFMGFLPKTVIIILIASLAAAIVVLPVAMSRLMRAHVREGALGDDSELPPLGPLMRGYKQVLELSIRFRYLALGGMVALFFATLVIFGVFNHGVEFFPNTEPDRVFVRIVAPDGTDVQTTDRVARRVEAVLAGEPNVDVFVTEVGVSAHGDDLSGSQASPNEGRITVDFLPHRNNAQPGDRVRIEDTSLTAERIRQAIAPIPGVRITVENEQNGPPVGAPISVEIQGDDYHAVGAVAQDFRRKIEALAGATELRENYKVGRPELRLRVDRGAAKRIGVSTVQVGNTVRTAVAGTKASTLRENEDEYDITVELAPQHREDLQRVLDLRLPGREDTSPDTFPVPLSAVASYELAGGTGAIHHVDQKLVVTISGDITEGFQEVAVRQQVQELIDAYEPPPGIYIDMGGAQDEQDEASAFLTRAMVIACGLILLVLVTQFDSLMIPGIILASVILSWIGVLWGLLLTATPFGIIMTGIGVISLAGVVVNNAIVLLDYVGQLRDRGFDAHDALIRAGITRFRPVMLTAITTLLGLVPMAIGLSIDFGNLRVLVGGASADWWGPMAIAMIFGLAFATILTLVMVPTMYTILEDLRWLWARVTTRRAAPTAEALAKVGLAALLVLGGAGEARAVTLDEAIRAAEANNLDLKIVAEQSIQTGTLRGQAWSRVTPHVSVNGSYIVNEFPIILDSSAFIPEEFEDLVEPGEPIVIQQKSYWTTSASVTQPLFNGAALPGMKVAYKQTKAARLDESAMRQRLHVTVARVYYGLAVARATQELAQEALDTSAGQLDLAERQAAAGLAPRRAVIQAELGVSRAKRELAAAEEQVVAAEQAFARETGLPPDSDVALPDEIAVPVDVATAVEKARSVRPDVLAAYERAAASGAQRGVVAMGWAPRVDAAFTWQWSENAGFAGKNDSWMFTIQGSWTLWDGGLRIAQGREAASRARMATYAFEKQQDAAEEEVRVAWERLERAHAAIDAVAYEEELAAESLLLAQKAFEAGSGTWLEVEEAELAVRSAKLTALSERMTRDLAALDVLAAAGLVD